jgi:tetratricopeptide (TPR) repeat protein
MSQSYQPAIPRIVGKTIICVLVTLIIVSCGRKESGNNPAASEISVFENARKAADIGTSITALHRIIVLDSTETWAVDSLAWYYYFFTQNVDAADIYNTLALKNKPDDIGMNEIRAKILIQKRQDTSGIELFEKLWQRTKDYTFLYNISATHILTGRVQLADSMVTSILALNPIPQGNVRIEVAEARSRQQIPVDAAFLYLKSYLMFLGNERQQAVQIVQRCLEIKPDFILARDMLENLTQPRQPQGAY